MRLLHFTTKRKFAHELNLFTKEQNDRYDLVLGRDFGQALGINVLNKSKTFEWDNIESFIITRGHWHDQNIVLFHDSKIKSLQRKKLTKQRY